MSKNLSACAIRSDQNNKRWLQLLYFQGCPLASRFANHTITIFRQKCISLRTTSFLRSFKISKDWRFDFVEVMFSFEWFQMNFIILSWFYNYRLKVAFYINAWIFHTISSRIAIIQNIGIPNSNGFEQRSSLKSTCQIFTRKMMKLVRKKGIGD